MLAGSTGLISMSARIYGPRSCVLTEEYAACSSIGEYGRPTVKLYSIKQESFGACLCSINLEQSKEGKRNYNVNISVSDVLPAYSKQCGPPSLNIGDIIR